VGTARYTVNAGAPHVRFAAQPQKPERINLMPSPCKPLQTAQQGCCRNSIAATFLQAKDAWELIGDHFM